MSAPINLDALTRPTYSERPARPDAELRRAVDAADPAGISSAAAALLAHVADRLSWTQGMSIVRRRGDGSLGDRWPSVANALRKTDADDIAEQVTRSPVFRKLVAPQGDAPGGSVSTAEASRFGEAVLSLLDRTNRRHASTAVANGFSHQTIFPALAAAIAMGACKMLGVAMSTTCMSSRSITVCQSIAVSCQPQRSAMACRLARSRPQTTWVRSPNRVGKNRLT